ncbi:MAG: hypothetical protein R3268_07160 [Acidiferrobacterales bacterium]|nr:hypothetical protein [Acidiferrobacterales bacterium]
MAAPHPRLRKELSAPGLLKAIRGEFERLGDHRSSRRAMSLPDALMSGLAMFGLKYPSLLKFDEAYQDEARIRHNLRTLYGVERAPCDTQLRTILDPVAPELLRGAFVAVHRRLQRQRALRPYEYLNGHYLVSLDGTGQYASSAISCPECCVKHTRAGPRYYHQLLGAVLVHPRLKAVLPLAPEPITRADGATKNDCERNASRRLLQQLREHHPQLKLIVLEDSLASNGPHLELLQRLKLHYIIGVKPGDHEALFDAVQVGLITGATQEWEYTDAEGIEHGYRWCNDLALNASHPELRVNFLEYWRIQDGQETVFSWVTDLALNPQTVEPIMRGGRCRWKVENETFNTLKNQGYALEHNYGHGRQHLSSVLALLMMLAFLVDQVQELSCRLFQAARASCRSRTSLWERLRARVVDFYVPDWPTLWQSIIHHAAGGVLAPDTS